MAPITKTCRFSGENFVITDEDQEFYKTIKVPLPTLSPKEHLRRRLTFRNERSLYQRTCDLCQKPTIAFFEKNVPFPVYCNNCWWSDRWDPTSYGRDIDFDRPFFDQFKDLFNEVPKVALLQLNNENCDYNSYLAFSKNTYMSPGSYTMEDCFYARKSQFCKDCADSNAINKCELVTDSTNCDQCYRSHHLINCRGCSNSAYLSDCSNCQDCFMCVGLKNKKFHFKNKPCSEKEYRKILANYAQKPQREVEEGFRKFDQSIPKKAQIQLNCENSSGDYLYNCNNATECFDCFDIEDSKYLVESVNVKNSMDLSMHDKEIQFCYELSSGGEKSYHTKFSFCTCASPNSEYCFECFYLSDSFGCDGFHARKQYCILNKQYSKEDYEQLRAQLIEYMKTTGEYGEFFPIALSPFAYNETIAQDYFPLTKEEAINRGYRWKDRTIKAIPATADLPHDIQQVPKNIVNETLVCDDCRRNYRLIAQELKLYKTLGLPAPRLCGDCRFKKLQSWRNPKQLWKRQCNRCNIKIQTTYSPEDPHIVYCEQCYLETMV